MQPQLVASLASAWEPGEACGSQISFQIAKLSAHSTFTHFALQSILTCRCEQLSLAFSQHKERGVSIDQTIAAST